MELPYLWISMIPCVKNCPSSSRDCNVSMGTPFLDGPTGQVARMRMLRREDHSGESFEDSVFCTNKEQKIWIHVFLQRRSQYGFFKVSYVRCYGLEFLLDFSNSSPKGLVMGHPGGSQSSPAEPMSVATWVLIQSLYPVTYRWKSVSRR